MTAAQDRVISSRLRDTLPVLARVIWLAAFAATVVMFVAGAPLILRQLQEVCLSSVCQQWQLDPGYAASLAGLGLSLHFYAITYFAIEAVFVTTWCTLAALIFWRRPSDPMAFLASFMMVTFGGTAFTDTITVLVTSGASWWRWPVTMIQVVGSVSVFSFFYLFPDGKFTPQWTRFAAAGWFVWCLLGYFSPADSPINQANPNDWFFMVGVFGFLVAGVATQVYRYRRISSPAQRQQTKWVISGLAVAILGIFVGSTFPAIFQPAPPAPSAMLYRFGTIGYFYLDWLLVPFSIAVAIARYRLFDIDRLINRALVYAALTAALAFVYAATVALIQQLIHFVSGQESSLALIASTLITAALFAPLRQRIQAFIDRRFYRRKYDAAKVLAAFGTKIRDEVELGQLSEQLLEVAGETMQPTTVSLWLRGQGGKESRNVPGNEFDTHD